MAKPAVRIAAIQFGFVVGILAVLTRAAQLQIVEAERESGIAIEAMVVSEELGRGLVNAPYAIPQPEFGIEKVTDRYYRGLARAKEEIDPVIQLFKEKREFINALILNFEPLKKKVREEMVRYIDGFYEDLDNSRKIKYVFQEAVDHN